MPLAILGDTSLILNQPYSDTGTTYRTIFTKILDTILSEIEYQNTFDMVQLHKLSDGSVISSFNSTFSSHKNSLSKCSLDDVSSNTISEGFCTVMEILDMLFSRYTAFHLIILAHQSVEFDLPSNFELPHLCTISTYLVGTNQLQCNSFASFTSLCSRFYGNSHFIDVRNASWQSTVLTLAQNWTSKTYVKQSATLFLGYLHAKISLLPAPLSAMFANIASQNSLNTQFPNIISILGFLPKRLVFSIPTLLRICVLPEEDKSVDNTKTAPSQIALETAASSSYPYSPLVPLLLNSMDKKQSSALVRLGDDWFGILNSFQSNTFALEQDSHNVGDDDSKSNIETLCGFSGEPILTLHILKPGYVSPTLGHLDSFVVQQYFNDTESLGSDFYLNTFPLPLPNGWPSYNPLLNFPTDFVYTDGGSSGLWFELSLLQTYITDLPTQRARLFQHMERLRQYSQLYMCQSIIETISSNLIRNLTKRKLSTLTGFILQRLNKCVEQKRFPLEWTESDEEQLKELR